MTLRTRHFDRAGTGGVTVTELGFGTAPLGNLYRAISDDSAARILDRAWALGVRYFDTAPLYGMGLSETRLNRFLRGKNRGDYVLSSKVGRLLKAVPPDRRDGVGKWFEVPSRVEVYDYSYDGVMRSFETSLERLGVDRIDILYAHDLDMQVVQDQSILEARLAQFMDGGYRALVELREQGAIRAIGAGLNMWEYCQWLAERGDFDLFLLAGRYTLLEQGALESFLPLCEKRSIGIVIGGPYNSGILATGAKEGAYFNYEAASPEILDKVSRIEAICARHKIRLIDAAFQFPLRHPAVLSVIPGGQSVEEMESNAQAALAEIPDALWEELRNERLLRDDAPT